MPLFGLGATELLLILLVIVVLFLLPKKLPELVKSIKQAKSEWSQPEKSSKKEGKKKD